MIVQAQAGRLPFADNTAHAVVTSPPYWGGLRKYAGVQDRLWPAIAYSPMPGLPEVEIPEQLAELGHEPDPFAFVGHLFQVFRECRRTLRRDGVLVVNLGDCYSGSSMSGGDGTSSTLWNDGRPREGALKVAHERQRRFMRASDQPTNTGLASKNLLLMPWRLALAMQADGWILRSRMPGGIETEGGLEPDIIWHKSSCMPESCRDRPTVDFEDVLIFSQRKSYFWDQEAGREPIGDAAVGRRYEKARSGRAKHTPGQGQSGQSGGTNKNFSGGSNPAGRNMRTVWTINPEPTDEEHFAAFPVELASRLIRVTTSEKGCCPECGAQWKRVVEKQRCVDGLPADNLGTWDTGKGAPSLGAQGIGHWRYSTRTTDLGFRPTCDHAVDPIPCTVLDPFAGLGRTWEACRATGRRFLGTDLGLEYCRLALSRNDLEAKRRRKLAERGKTITGPLFRDLTDGM